jgi:hypothetical protein
MNSSSSSATMDNISLLGTNLIAVPLKVIANQKDCVAGSCCDSSCTLVCFDGTIVGNTKEAPRNEKPGVADVVVGIGSAGWTISQILFNFLSKSNFSRSLTTSKYHPGTEL